MGSTVVDDGRQGIQSVERAADVLRALEEGLGPMTLTQIAAAAGMSPSKAHRYLVSLGRVGLVSQSAASGSCDMGPVLRRLGMEWLRRVDEVGLVSDALPALRDKTVQAVNLAVWGDHDPVVVRWNYGSYALPITVRVGATITLLASSVGRVFLAHLPLSLTLPVLRSQAHDVGPEPTAAEVEAISAPVRRDGCALTSGGVVPGVTSLAAPVFSDAESLPLVISVAMPAREVDPPTLAAVRSDLLASVEELSRELGHATEAR